VRNHGGAVPVKELQHAVVDPSQSNAKFVNVVSQVVSFRAAEFVPQLLEAGKLYAALNKGAARQPVQPLQERNGSILLPVKNDFGLRHPYPFLAMFA
jgi:hypothetical protein